MTATNSPDPQIPGFEAAATQTEVTTRITTLPPSVWALIVAIAVLASAVAAAVSWHVIPRPQRFATVDLDEAFQVQQLRMTLMITGPGVGNVDRTQAATLAMEFGPKTEAALREVAAQCQCLLLVRGAVAQGQLPDYTPAIKRALGQDGLDVRTLRQQLAVRANPDSARPGDTKDLPLNFLRKEAQ